MSDERERVAAELAKEMGFSITDDDLVLNNFYLLAMWDALITERQRREQAERERDTETKRATYNGEAAAQNLKAVINLEAENAKLRSELEMAVVHSYDAAQTRSTVDEIRGLRAENAKLLAADLVRAKDISRLTVERDAAREREVELRDGLRQIRDAASQDYSSHRDYIFSVAAALLSPTPAEPVTMERCEDCAWHGCSTGCGCKCHTLSPAPATLGKYDVRVDAPGVHVTLCAASPAEQPAPDYPKFQSGAFKKAWGTFRPPPIIHYLPNATRIHPCSERCESCPEHRSGERRTQERRIDDFGRVSEDRRRADRRGSK